MKLVLTVTFALLASSSMTADAQRPRQQHRRRASKGSYNGGTSSSQDAAISENAVPPASLQSGQCVICDRENKENRPGLLELEYVGNGGPGVSSPYQIEGKASCRTQTFPASTTLTVDGRDIPVSTGTQFTLGQAGDKMGAETEFEFSNGQDSCYIHTSCSVPIVTDDIIGPFKVLGPKDSCVGTPPPPSDGECIICDKQNKNRPGYLTLRYNGGKGAISKYQDDSKASCRDQVFPGSTTVTAYGVDYQVNSGTIFTIGDGGKMDAETDFTFSSGQVDECFIHTSCSVPLVVGDQIGPFEVLEGNECKAPPQCVCKADATYNNGVLNIDFSMCGAEPDKDDWIGIYPCGGQETLEANDEWNDKVFYEDVFDIGYTKGEVYVNEEPIWFAYTCGSPGSGCQKNRGNNNWPSSGKVTLDPTNGNAQKYPWAFRGTTELKPGCYVALLNRETSISGPPYPTICKTWAEGDKFNV